MEEIETDKYKKDLEEIVKIYRRLKPLSDIFENAIRLIIGIFIFVVAEFCFLIISYVLFLLEIFSTLQILFVVIISIFAALFIAIAIVVVFLR